MAVITPKPIIRCDNCGRQEEMDTSSYGGCPVSPKGWGGFKIDPTKHDYPDNARMGECCPQCLKLVHSAVEQALRVGRGEANGAG